jgi:hypothetical protein
VALDAEERRYIAQLQSMTKFITVIGSFISRYFACFADPSFRPIRVIRGLFPLIISG